MKNITEEWNLFDTLLFKFDLLIVKVRDIKADNNIDYEEIIEAETKHLKKENESLKTLQYPKKVKQDDNNYFCPNSRCNEKISSILINKFNIKYCPECGQRIYNATSTRHEVIEN